MAKGSSTYNDFASLLQQLDQKQIAPVYLLHGEEYHFLEILLNKIESVVLDESTSSFNHHLFYGKETSVNDIINVCRRFPMMAERQLVVYKEAQYCTTPDHIVAYLENPAPTSVLVWYHPGKTLPMNRKPVTSFKKSATIFTADPIAESEILRVINTYVTEQGYDIEPKPLQLLV